MRAAALPLALLLACTGGGDVPVAGAVPDGAVPVRVTLDGSPIARVSERFLSVAVDASQVLGGHWWSPDGRVEVGVGQTVVAPFDFSRPRLRRMARELAPALLRIGGTEADKVFYDLSEHPAASSPPPYELTLTRDLWQGIVDFAVASGFEVMFTLNAGPGPRDASGAWTPDNARNLLAHAAGRGDPVTVWELGNEVNGYPLIHGISVSGGELARDFATLRAVADELAPSALLAAPSSAYWPAVGEMGAVTADFLAAAGPDVDIVTWHYYPTQSRRCPVASVPAGPWTLLDPAALDEAGRWAAQVEGLAATHARNARVWLGETGNAQCGGEPGVSDSFVGSLWWIDELGLIAARGEGVVVRQTLAGSNYGMIDDATLEPNPDWWASVLWKRLMGSDVLAAASGDATLRARAHCAAAGGGLPPGAVTVALVNLSRERDVAIVLDGLGPQEARAYVVTAPDPVGREVRLGGVTLAVDADGAPPALDPVARRFDGDPWWTLPALSYAFLVLPDARAPACGRASDSRLDYRETPR
jgi:heparanase 1